MLEVARDVVEKLLEQDPNIELKENEVIKNI